MNLEIVNIKIQGVDYEIKCPHDQIKALQDAAELVNTKMSEVKKKTSSNEKAAILTALNISHQLLIAESDKNIDNKSNNEYATEQISLFINNIDRKIENILAKSTDKVSIE